MAFVPGRSRLELVDHPADLLALQLLLRAAEVARQDGEALRPSAKARMSSSAQ